MIMPDPNRPLLTPEELLHGWTPQRIGRRVLTLAETDSTNSVALAAAGDPSADGLAVFADFQTAGRGRHGRTWTAPRGAGILCSVLLSRSIFAPPKPGEAGQPADDIEARSPVPGDDWHAEGGWLTLASAVAVCDGIRRATDVTPCIKWPNDLCVGGRKLAGILIESRLVEQSARAWVVGIGINCYQQPGHFPPELRDKATSLELVSSHPVDRAALARELLAALDHTLSGQGPETPELIHARWRSFAEPLGQTVHLRSEGHEYTGRTVSVDPTGGLIVQCDDGRQRWFDPLLTMLL
jgi:BirA family transcriptional regulator, biotin operon repressor / biotin---[acetyl-CoA-carboxylase] ligase